MRDKVGIVYGLLLTAGVAVLRGESPARAARLWGAEESLREAISFPVSPFDRAHYDYEGYQATVRSQLYEAAWEAAWSEGRAMSAEEALEYALSEEGDEPQTAAAAMATSEPPAPLLLPGGTERP